MLEKRRSQVSEILLKAIAAADEDQVVWLVWPTDSYVDFALGVLEDIGIERKLPFALKDKTVTLPSGGTICFKTLDAMVPSSTGSVKKSFDTPVTGYGKGITHEDALRLVREVFPEITEDEAEYVLRNHTGFPHVYRGDAEPFFRQQLLEYKDDILELLVSMTNSSVQNEIRQEYTTMQELRIVPI